MSEQTKSRGNIRYQLLVTVSAAALLASAYSVDAADADRPVIWIELGAQFERLQDNQQIYLPPFMNPPASFVTISPAGIQRPLLSDFGGEGKISFQPEDSDWVFSGAVRFGKSGGGKHRHQQTIARVPNPLYPTFLGNTEPRYFSEQYENFADAAARKDANHLIVDFMAGRDVGLGIFGNDSTSVLSAGVRYAQFASKSSAELGALPTIFHYKYVPFIHASIPFSSPHIFHATEHKSSRFLGIGPSISWNASAEIAGSDEAGFTFDWGVNAALLFGRQKTHVHTQTAEYIRPAFASSRVTHYKTHLDTSRTKSVAVPNLGGFAGISLKFPNAKISIGYRADFFVNAMDGGIEVRKNETLGFIGPFARFSVGVGD